MVSRRPSAVTEQLSACFLFPVNVGGVFLTRVWSMTQVLAGGVAFCIT